MRYFIGYLVRGEIKKYQEKLIDRISENFDIKNLNNYVPAHFTLKAPFETENINLIEKLIEKLSLKNKQSPIWIDGIDNFNKRIIYLKGIFSLGALETFRELNSQLREIGWMKFGKYDLDEGNFHSTLVRAKSERQFADIMKFLSDENPYFKFKFDNISIFCKRGKKWEIYKKFELK